MPRLDLWVQGGFGAALGRVLGVGFESRGRNQAFIHNGYIHYPIKAIEKTKAEDLAVYNCEVAGTHSYLANGVASHNCMHDMSHGWDDFVCESLTHLPYGYAFMEEVFKKRNGEQPGQDEMSEDTPSTEEPQHPASSVYDDGLVGWRKLPLRAQETTLRWDFDGYSSLRALIQLDWHGEQHTIPITKGVLIRNRRVRNNPEGFALALDTPIPTPDGWRTMADMEVGSRVFDEQGRVRYVTAVADWEDRPCYELTFTDGSTIIADENHQWHTQSVQERRGLNTPKLYSTAEIAETLTEVGSGKNRHAIPLAEALDYSEQHLAVDPYLLGLWLGDGYARQAKITCHADDVEEQAVLVEAAGYTANVKRENGSCALVVRSGVPRVDSPQTALRRLNVLQNKHIPAHYLRGSQAQRLAVLQGLMDSDGTVDEYGRCEFMNGNRQLVDGVAELVRSLGCACRIGLRHKAGDTIEWGERWLKRTTHYNTDAYAVRFRPSFVPFRLARKAARCKPDAHRYPYHYVADAKRVENRRTRCIEVDSPSHLFLAGETMVPTHNSILRRAWTSYFRMRGLQDIEATGAARDLAGIPYAKPPPNVDLYSAENADLYNTVRELVTTIHRDEDEGIVYPSAEWDIGLMSAAGSRQFDLDKVIRRYEQRIAASVAADFMLLGQDGLGSYAMVDVKSELFGMAVDAMIEQILKPMNRYAIPRLLKLNGVKTTDPPKIVATTAGRIDLEKVGLFLGSLAGAGLELPKDPAFLKQMFEAAGLGSNFTFPPQKAKAAEPAKPAAAKPEPSKLQKAGGEAIDVSEPLATRGRVLASQLDREVAGRLQELGARAAAAYLGTVRDRTSPTSKRETRALVAQVVRSLGIAGWVQQRLQPLLVNHAGRVARDTERTLVSETNLDLALGDATGVVGSRRLTARDLEPAIRAAILKAVEDGAGAGESPDETAARIRRSVPAGRFRRAGSGYRSQLVSHEETAQMQRQASLVAYRSNSQITGIRLRGGDRDGEILDIADSPPAAHVGSSLSYDPIVQDLQPA
jgi:hypothetical protein